MVLTITKVNAPQNKLNIKAPYSMDPIGTTTHETGNIATAMAEISYMIGNSSSTGYHFAVDDTRAVQGLPLDRNAFHSGDGKTGRGNRKTIGVEHCYNWNGKTTTKNDSHYNPLFQKAIKNGVELQAQLFLKYPHWGVPTAGVNMFRHYDHSRKNCPQRMIEEGYWNTYVALVRARYLELKGIKADPVTPTAPKVESKPAAGSYTGNSLVDYLVFHKADSSFANRKKLAEANGIKNYSGTSAQNTNLLNLLRNGKLSPKPAAISKSIDQLAREVIDNKHGSGDARKKALGSQYDAVQARVNQILLGTKKPAISTPVIKVGDKVTASKLYGSGADASVDRASSITGYVEKINNSWKNPYRLERRKGKKDYLGFARKADLKK